MYLSRLILNPRDRRVRHDLADCQELHRTVLSAFPQVGVSGQGARAAFGVLHRLDADSRFGRPVLLVQSQERPDWSRLSPGYLADARGVENPACKAVNEQYGRLTEGSVLAFRLLANPTKRLNESQPGSRLGKGKRAELRGEEAWQQWLGRKAEQGGFRVLAVRANPAVPDAQATDRDKVTGRRASPEAEGRERGGGTLTFGAVLFQGRLQVIDAAAFRETLGRGVGSGKAYGFGLLSVAPAAG